METSYFTQGFFWYWIPLLVLAYFIGNISPSILIGRAAGIDIRKEGSGNAGTTNVLRVLGKKAAALTLIIDILKGVVAVFIGRLFGGEALAVLCGAMAFAGHVWPAVFGFRGGKGIATGLGVVLALNISLAFLCLAAAIIGVLVSRRVSVGSLLASLVLPIAAYWLLPESWVIFLILAVIIWIKHRLNIRRLLRGEEPKINLKKKKP